MEFDERRYRPLSTVDLFDEAFDLYKRNFVLFLSIVAIVVVPSTTLTDIYALKWVNAIVAQATQIQLSEADPTIALNYLTALVREGAISLLVYIPVWTLQFVTLTVAVSARYLDQPMSVGKAYLEGIRRFIPGLVATVIFLFFSSIGVCFMALGAVMPDFAAVFVSIGTLLESVVAMIVLAKFPLYMGAVVAEKMGPIKALNRSGQLTKSDTGRVIWAILCMTAITMVVGAAMQGVLLLFTGGIVSSEYLTIPALSENKFVADQIANGLATLLLTPFSIIVMTLLYYDQRIRNEGFDMELLADRLGYRPVALPKAAYAPALTVSKKGRK
jgi:hypothetical protein